MGIVQRPFTYPCLIRQIPDDDMTDTGGETDAHDYELALTLLDVSVLCQIMGEIVGNEEAETRQEVRECEESERMVLQQFQIDLRQ